MSGSRFIESSLRNFAEVLERTLHAEELTRQGGFLQSVDPRVKVVGLFCLIAAAALSRRLEVIGCIFAAALLLAAGSRIPVRALLARIWAGAFLFSGLIVLPALFLTPGAALGQLPALKWTITAQGLRGAIYLVSRVETTATLSMLLVASTPWTHVLKALRVLRMPLVAIVSVGMTYRYILLMIGAAREMFESRRSRLVGEMEGTERRRLAVATAGVLLSKSMYLADEVYLAMQSRGFRGEVYLLDEFEMKPRDWAVLAGFALLGMAAIWAGR